VVFVAMASTITKKIRTIRIDKIVGAAFCRPLSVGKTRPLVGIRAANSRPYKNLLPQTLISAIVHSQPKLVIAKTSETWYNYSKTNLMEVILCFVIVAANQKPKISNFAQNAVQI